MKKITAAVIMGAILLAGFGAAAGAAVLTERADNFYTSDRVRSEKVTFRNLLGMELTGTLFSPSDRDGSKKYAALAVGHPFGAVRQQAANLYATKMAEAGFVALSFDQVFWGESGGSPRGTVLPDLYVESFCAAVDYLRSRPFVDPEKVGTIGICASGAFSIAAAKIDPRIKAMATVSMYDMGEYFRTGIGRNRTAERRNRDLQIAAEQRDRTFGSGEPLYGPGQNDPVFVEAEESNAFYQTERGHIPSNDRRSTPASYVKYMNFYPFIDIDSLSPRPAVTPTQPTRWRQSRKSWSSSKAPTEPIFMTGRK